ncbi:MAG: zinc-binding dehydrogenase, partial [Lentisphaeria bacterium]|nr:zinc-binding dehydrogenase [Lentisphaeria bacterium]
PGLKEKIHALTDSKGVDMLIEVTGNPQAIVQGLKLTAKFGRCALVGCSRTATESIDFYNLVHRPGITILGAHNMARPLEENKPGVWTMREDMKTLLRLMAAGRLDAKRMLTRIADPADAPEIYAQLLKENSGVPGIVFDWKNY